MELNSVRSLQQYWNLMIKEFIFVAKDAKEFFKKNPKSIQSNTILINVPSTFIYESCNSR